MYVYVCLCMRVCMCVCMYASMYVCMYGYMYVCVYVSVYLCMDVCMYVCMHVCMYVCTCVSTYVRMYVCTIYVCMHVCMHVCMCACVYACALCMYESTCQRRDRSRFSRFEMVQLGIEWTMIFRGRSGRRYRGTQGWHEQGVGFRLESLGAWTRNSNN